MFKMISLPSDSSIKSIKLWQEKNANRIVKLIHNSPCLKWKNDSSFLYPCVCPLRYRSCVEIEFYYNILEIIKIKKQEDIFKKAIENYELTSLDKTSWYLKHKHLEKVLLFNPYIQVITNNSSFEKVIFQLAQEDFEYTLALKKLFEAILYQE